MTSETRRGGAVAAAARDVRVENDVDRARADGSSAARAGKPAGVNPYAFDKEQSTRRKSPVDAEGRVYRQRLDDSWHDGWLSAARPGALAVPRAVALQKAGCSRGHNAMRLATCRCGEEFCTGPGHAPHACGGAS